MTDHQCGRREIRVPDGFKTDAEVIPCCKEFVLMDDDRHNGIPHRCGLVEGHDGMCQCRHPGCGLMFAVDLAAEDEPAEPSDDTLELDRWVPWVGLGCLGMLVSFLAFVIWAGWMLAEWILR